MRNYQELKSLAILSWTLTSAPPKMAACSAHVRHTCAVTFELFCNELFTCAISYNFVNNRPS